MGLMDFVSSALSFVPGVGPILGAGVKMLGSAFDSKAGSTALDIGAKYIGDKYINDPNTEAANEFSSAASAAAFERSQGAYKTRYQNTMEDMKKAGLNPILASSGGFNVGNSPNATPAQSHMSPGQTFDYGSSALKLAESDKAEADIEKSKSETDLKIQEAKESIERISKIRAEKGLITSQERESVAKMFESEQRFSLMANQIKEIGSKIEQIQAQTDLTQEERKNAQAMRSQILTKTRELSAEAQNLEYSASQLREQSKVYDSPIGWLLSTIRETVKSLLPLSGDLKR